MFQAVERFIKGPESHGFKPYAIVAVRGEEREGLIEDVSGLLRGPDLSAKAFNEFCETMIRLIGGEQSTVNTSHADWINMLTGQAFRFTRSKEFPWNFGGIMTGRILPDHTIELDQILTFGEIIDTVDASTGKPQPTIKIGENYLYVIPTEGALESCRQIYRVYDEGLVRPTFEIYLNQHGVRTREPLSLLNSAVSNKVAA